MVMRRLVNRQGKRKISADGVTSQVPEAGSSSKYGAESKNYKKVS